MNIQKDKAKHIAVSFMITLVMYMIEVQLNMFEIGDVLLSSIGIGIIKEVYDDRSGKGTPDYKDIAANFIGVSIAYILIRISGLL